MINIRFALIVITLVIASCDGTSDATLQRGNVKISEISNVPFTIHDKDAVFINFVSDTAGECSLTLALERIEESGRIEVLNEEPGDVDLNCLKSGKLFLLSNLATTNLEVHFDTVSKTELMIRVNAQLYSIRTQESLVLSDVQVFVGGKRRALIGT